MPEFDGLDDVVVGVDKGVGVRTVCTVVLALCAALSLLFKFVFSSSPPVPVVVSAPAPVVTPVPPAPMTVFPGPHHLRECGITDEFYDANPIYSL